MLPLVSVLQDSRHPEKECWEVRGRRLGVDLGRRRLGEQPRRVGMDHREGDADPRLLLGAGSTRARKAGRLPVHTREGYLAAGPRARISARRCPVPDWSTVHVAVSITTP